MDKINSDINNCINQLELKLKQLKNAKKEIKWYYGTRISEINQELIDLRAQSMYYKNSDDTNIIDLHGANKYFVENYLIDLMEDKFYYYNEIIIITGKGSGTIFKSVLKFLEKSKYKFKIKRYEFFVTGQSK